jgi:polyisoprenyl-teichoic acid--peptidoglycan teichoic acid transferase
MRKEYNFTPSLSDLDEHVIIARKMNRNSSPRRRNSFVMTPTLWGLLVAFLLAAVITIYLTFAVVKEMVFAGSPFAAIRPFFYKPQPAEGSPLSLNSPLQEDVGPTPQVWDGAGRVTILAMGLDSRDWEDGGEGPSRTDSMILLTVDPTSRTAGMLSLPRDLWVNIPGYGYGKINTAHFIGEAYGEPGGGSGLAVQTVEEFLGIDVAYYVRLDFNAFERFVDEIGGIEIEVPEEIKVDPIGPGNTVTLQPGLQTLDGPTALAYARNRETAGSDFDRAERTQQVILAIRNKILKLNMLPKLITKAPVLYSELASGIQTNLSLEEIIKLAWLAAQIPTENIRRGVITMDMVTDSWSPEGFEILLPDTDKIRQLRDEIFTTTGPASPAAETVVGDPVELMKQENARISVLNGTYTTGLAATTGDYLTNLGMNVTATGNAQELSEYTSIIDYSGKPYTVKYLVDLLHIDPNQIFNRYDPNSEVDITIALGADWAENNTMP